MKGIAAYLKQENGVAHLVLDDVEAEHGKSQLGWKYVEHFTSNEFEAREMDELLLTKDQFAEIGENLIIRLLALNERLK